jgi:uncharacterized membrane protein
MNKFEFLETLKRALTGLPAETAAKTMAFYEQSFIDGVMNGRSEEEIAKELGDPRKIALTLRTNSHMAAFEQKKTPVNLLRLLVAVIGLAIFNLFMVVPALVYASLLAAVYACSLAFYVAGIAITASGLSGANELVFKGPLRHIILDERDIGGDPSVQTKVTISEDGIHVVDEPALVIRNDNGDEENPPSTSKVIRRAEAVAERGVHITTGLDSDSRTTQALFGFMMVIGGIVLFLLSLVVSKYTLIGLKRYFEMNFSLLRGN